MYPYIGITSFLSSSLLRKYLLSIVILCKVDFKSIKKKFCLTLYVKKFIVVLFCFCKTWFIQIFIFLSKNKKTLQSECGWKDKNWFLLQIIRHNEYNSTFFVCLIMLSITMSLSVKKDQRKIAWCFWEILLGFLLAVSRNKYSKKGLDSLSLSTTLKFL